MALPIACLLATVLWLLAPGFAVADSSLAAGIVAEMNLARTKPESYVAHLRDLRRRYRGKKVTPPGSLSPQVTEEGVAAVDEAIRFLRRQKPLRPLKESEGLRKAAADLVSDQGKSGVVGHIGGKTGTLRQRIERQGTWTGRIGENISYGPTDPRWIVMGLIVDDGIRDRGHRKNIFDRSFGEVGVSCGAHLHLNTVCVMDFATKFGESGK